MGGAVAITLASLRPDLAGEVTFLGTQKVTAAHGVCRSVRSLVNGTRPTMRERLLSLSIPQAYVFGEYDLADALGGAE